MILLLALACQTDHADKSGDSSGDSAEVEVDRGPTAIDVDGDPNGLWWDADEGALYLADDNGNRILRWTDADGFSLAAELPEASADGPGLGQLVRTSDGTLVVPRFGYGTSGDVVYVNAAGSSGVVPGLDVERRRIGLTVADDGTLYDGWFVSSDGGRVGGVSVLDLAGGETDVLDSLGKPVGLLASGDTLWVTDQDLNQVLTAPLASPDALALLTEVDSPDLLCAGPDGGVYTGGKDGSVRLVSAAGEVTTPASGYQEVRGVAYDAENGRLFLVDHDGDESDGLTHQLQIVPVDP